MRKLTILFAVALLCSTAQAQAPEDMRPLAARTYTRSFNDSNVSLEFTLRAGPLMEPGKRRFIEIDIDTLMHDDAIARGENTIPLNGFIAIALPRGIEPDGELRMKFYNGASSRYDFMYSAQYPPAVVKDLGIQQAMADATSKDVNAILAGLGSISQALDGSISWTGPQDRRVLGSDPNYAITGTSWLIPCNSLFQQLVDPFDPAGSLQVNPRLKATLPVRIAEQVANPRILVFAGSLSTAVGETTVMSDAIPANVRLLEQAPAIAAGGTDPGTETDPAEEGSEEQATPAAVPLRALAYSFGWAAWEAEVDLSPMIMESVLLPGYQGSQPEQLDTPVNLDPPGSRNDGPITISAADSSERLNLDGPEDPEQQETEPEAGSEVEDGADPEQQQAPAESEQPLDGNEADVASTEQTAEPDLNDEAEEETPAAAETEDSGLQTQDAPEPGSADQNEDPENGNADADAGTDTPAADEVAPGSLAELKARVEERRERDTGNSVNIELPSSATESGTTQEVVETAEQVNQIQDEEVQQLPIDQAAGESGEEPVETERTEAPAFREDIPAFAFPEEIEAAQAAREQAAEQDSVAEEPAAQAQAGANTGAEVQEVEPGTLPGQGDMHSVPLKLITGRDGRKPGGSQGSTAPDYTQLYIGGGAAGSVAGTTPADLGDMVFVPGGKFLMGTDELASAGDEDERPLHEVELADFYIDKYPVTNRQYYQFVLADGYKPQGNWQKYFEPGTADMPVRGVTWDDASAYARWAGKRLPTEAEWEKAARGEDGRLYPWGNDWSSEILPRGSLNYRLVLNQNASSPYGALAMVGVLWQWTASSWAPYPYDPDASGSVKVLRGGAFSNGRNIIRCANRYPEEGSVGFNTFTFRCARDAN